jgi:D-inositol-3-phosphate glycosyltransferase
VIGGEPRWQTRIDWAAGRRHVPQRVAMLSVHTSPLEQPGSGDAGGMNVYIDQVARRMARRGVRVDVFTRATASDQPPRVEVEPGYAVRNVLAGPFGGVAKEDLPGLLCPFAAHVLRAATPYGPGQRFDIVHSHYWLSGQVGQLVRDRWGIPLVHTAHTLAKVKNAALAGDDDRREPRGREIGEEQVAAEADLLVAATENEARQWVRLYEADPDRVTVVPPGVDVHAFAPAPASARLRARAALGFSDHDVVLAFAGRIQPHKGPEVLVRALAELRHRYPDKRFRALIVGDSSGSGHTEPDRLRALAAGLDVAGAVRLMPAMSPARLADVYRAADVVAVPSHSESFGLVALEAQACGTPVVAAAVGGLPVAVRDGVSGLLVTGYRPDQWADALASIALDPVRRCRMAIAARAHAERFSWEATVDRLLDAYARAAAPSLVGLEAGA